MTGMDLVGDSVGFFYVEHKAPPQAPPEVRLFLNSLHVNSIIPH